MRKKINSRPLDYNDGEQTIQDQWNEWEEVRDEY